MRPKLLIFAKSPRMGLAKTRLARGVGMVAAWRTKRRLDALTCRVARSSRWETLLAVAPQQDLAASFPGVWPANLRRVGQGQGDLGQRMARGLIRFSRAPVCIIGSDLPDLKRSDLVAAFRALTHADVVLGPATDGGYWLIGMAPRAARRAQLAPVRWSSPHTLADTLACLPAQWRVVFLRELEDIDDAASLKRSTQR
ncbi:TIGR04282 family arsenosugar biosynthesis glycosyltransferase [Aquidulcibacter paucihalophilus]|uniref:TIGR04282 family arsenosugar biosynthesis glycosyltransferase n=1 Tax=Aquidulcibacter paucihalophilus TaxID=1978549 RepID=UPI000A1954B6|nr:TIGR04282 family arsenosugar biosynthesis glycosyltransferase [Aquidulcibacter paucihalophilus]